MGWTRLGSKSKEREIEKREEKRNSPQRSQRSQRSQMGQSQSELFSRGGAEARRPICLFGGLCAGLTRDRSFILPVRETDKDEGAGISFFVFTLIFVIIGGVRKTRVKIKVKTMGA